MLEERIVEVRHLIPARGASSSRITAARKYHYFALWLMVLFACMATLALLANPARAANLTVTNTKDSGSGSLRNAINKANTNGASDTITFRVADNSTITLTSGQLTIANDTASSDLSIVGPGARKLAVSGNDKSRVFRIAGGAKARIKGLTIKKGFVKGTDSAGSGGGIHNGGTLALINNIVSLNSASVRASLCPVLGCVTGGGGGGVYNDGTLTITNSTISRNRNSDSGETHGGGIYNFGTLTISDSTISRNTAPRGGGINNRGPLEITNSTITENSASGDPCRLFSCNGGAGGIANNSTLKLNKSTISKNSADNSQGGGVQGPGNVTITHSTVSDNSAVDGGGIYVDAGLYVVPRYTIKNSTISGNSATFRGGGIRNSDGLTIIENSTITKNTAPAGEGSGVHSISSNFTGRLGGNSRTVVRATIIAGNTNTDVDHGSEPSDSEAFESRGSNLIGAGNATGAFDKPGDKTNVSNPGLGVLARNGGPTKTHSLLKGSPAIDAVVTPAGTVAAAAVEEPCEVTEDQRGVIRPQDGDEDNTARCDIGAFELEDSEVIQPAPPLPPSDPPPSDPPPTPNSPKNPNACTIKGDAKNNVLKGTPKRDVICGFGGNDTIRGLGGNDLIKAGAGHDILSGQDGNDKLLGEGGNDVLYGGDGRDVLLGGLGKNVLLGGPGKDTERQGVSPSK